MSRLRDQRGSAAVFGIAFTGLLVTATLVGATVAALLVGQRRAAAGADLAALAGASALQQGRPACAEATELATANGTRLVRCETRGELVTVEVTVEVASVFGSGSAGGSTWTVRARARAGPVR